MATRNDAKSRNCKNCERDPALKAARGCYPLEAKTVTKVTLGGQPLEFRHCTKSIAQAVSPWFPHHRRLADSGVLPLRGAWDDQPLNYTQAMDILSNAQSLRMEDELKAK